MTCNTEPVLKRAVPLLRNSPPASFVCLESIAEVSQWRDRRFFSFFFSRSKGRASELNPPVEGDLGCWHDEVMPVHLFERGWPHRCGIVCCHGEGGGLEEELGEQTGVRGNGMNVSLILCYCVNATTFTQEMDSVASVVQQYGRVNRLLTFGNPVPFWRAWALDREPPSIRGSW